LPGTGLRVDSSAGKSVSDALRWERRRGRARRLARGVYGPVKCRAALSTGFIDEYWRCGPKQNRSKAGNSGISADRD
jgi:hypothetical protein